MIHRRIPEGPSVRQAKNCDLVSKRHAMSVNALARTKKLSFIPLKGKDAQASRKIVEATAKTLIIVAALSRYADLASFHICGLSGLEPSGWRLKPRHGETKQC